MVVSLHTLKHTSFFCVSIRVKDYKDKNNTKNICSIVISYGTNILFQAKIVAMLEKLQS